MRRKALGTALATVVVAGLLYGLLGQRSGSGLSYRFAEVERGTVEQVVASTGTLQATQTVEVGTQVSGLLSEIHADFNDQVQKGDLLARIDPSLLQQAVRSAEASLARSTAEVEHSRRGLARALELLETNVVAVTEVETAQYQAAVAEASFRQAQVSLEQARRNLEYTRILAPVDGVVIQRAVDVGQTVAASMSAPVLFLIAQDLSEMEILASVDESDIGLIHPGQGVRFTVQAYPQERFTGEVRQVRLQSKVVENVVTYAVVIGVDNSSGRLLPGMTATVDFIVAREGNALKVSTAALRFQPTDAMVAELQALRTEAGEGQGGSRGRTGEGSGTGEESGTGEGPRTGGGSGTGEESGTGEGSRTGGGSGDLRFAGLDDGSGRVPGALEPRDSLTPLYYLDEGGKLAVTFVERGLSDRQSTVIRGPGVREGMKIIVGTMSEAAATANGASTASNPFQSQNGNRPPGGGPPPM
jgi:HlyD family secretion protein